MSKGQNFGGRWSDPLLEAQIQKLESTLQRWMEERGLWFDSGFTSFLEHVDGEPGEPPVVTMLSLGGPMHEVLSGEDYATQEPAFSKLLKSLGYYYENISGDTIAIHPEDPELEAAFVSYFHWQWVCSLIEEDTADVFHELYEQFARRPEDLERLGWRDFEILLFRIFQNQGFEAVLGPGRGDDGVDLRLIQRAPLGDILTLVQAKRYAPRRKIDQTDVSALYGSGRLENANKALFVTTSSYAPVARRWAARTEGYLELAEADDVVKWCANASHGVIRDKASLVSPEHVSRLILQASQNGNTGIVRASGGWNITDNWFALVIKESKHAALLMALPKLVLWHDGYGQVGTHIPKLDGTTFASFNSDNVWRAKRSVGSGGVSYWDGHRGYYLWDGQPCRFDLCD